MFSEKKHSFLVLTIVPVKLFEMGSLHQNVRRKGKYGFTVFLVLALFLFIRFEDFYVCDAGTKSVVSADWKEPSHVALNRADHSFSIYRLQTSFRKRYKNFERLSPNLPERFLKYL